MHASSGPATLDALITALRETLAAEPPVVCGRWSAELSVDVAGRAFRIDATPKGTTLIEGQPVVAPLVRIDEAELLRVMRGEDDLRAKLGNGALAVEPATDETRAIVSAIFVRLAALVQLDPAFDVLDFFYADLMMDVGGVIGLDDTHLDEVDDVVRFILEKRKASYAEIAHLSTERVRFFEKIAPDTRDELHLESRPTAELAGRGVTTEAPKT